MEMTIIPCQQWLSVMPVPYVLSFLFPGVQITFYFIDYNQTISHHKGQSCLIQINGTYLNLHLGFFFIIIIVMRNCILEVCWLMVSSPYPWVGWHIVRSPALCVVISECKQMSIRHDILISPWYSIWMFSSGFPNISKPWSYVGQSGKGPEKKLNFQSILYRESLKELDYSAWRREGSGENLTKCGE